MNKKDIVVLGAGLVGSLMATFLARRGYRVQVFEKRPDMRKGSVDEGRSINLALSHRGLRALDKVDLLHKVHEICLPMRGRMIHHLQGNLTLQPYGKEGQYINSISRGQLNILLMDAAESAGARIHFEEECIDSDLESGITRLTGPLGEHQVRSNQIIGADGAFSGLREVFRKTEHFNFSQHYLPHGYKELSIPADAKDFALDPEALHIWPREQYMLIALPNLDRSFTCTLFLPFEGDVSFNTLLNEQGVLDFFEQSFPDAVPLMPDLTTEFFVNPTSSMVTIKCDPWQRGKACLIGDASHAIVPFYGQGMNAGFEDCRILDEGLVKQKSSFEEVFEEFQKKRIPDTNAIAALALQNFIEMRDLVADKEFLLRKKIEQKLHDLYPNHWTPLYSRVTFTDEPYSEALRIGNIQSSIMDKVMQQPDIEVLWESLDYEGIIKSLKAQVDLK